MPSIKPLSLLLLAVPFLVIRSPESPTFSDFNFMDCALLPLALFFIGFYLSGRLAGRFSYALYFAIPFLHHQLKIAWQIQWEWIYAARLQIEIRNSRRALHSQKNLSPRYYKRVEENIDHWESLRRTHNTLRKLYQEELQKLFSHRQEMFFLQGIDNRLHWKIYWWYGIPYQLECDPVHRLELAKRLSNGLHRFCERRLVKECERLYERLDVTQRRERLKTVMDELGIS